MARFLWLLVLLSVCVNAVVMPVVVPVVVDNSPAAGQGGSCVPPINFSKQNGCELRFDGRYSVNSYSCGRFFLKGDCAGNAYDVQEMGEWTFSAQTVLPIVVIGGMLVLFAAISTLMCRR